MSGGNRKRIARTAETALGSAARAEGESERTGAIGLRTHSEIAHPEKRTAKTLAAYRQYAERKPTSEKGKLLPRTAGAKDPQKDRK